MNANLNKNDIANQEVLAELKMMSKKEVAGIFQVSTSTLDRWVRAGLIKCVKLGKNVQQARVYFHYADVLEFKNKNYGFK